MLLRPFWIARVPITVAQYRALMEDGGYAGDGYRAPRGRTWKRKWQRPQVLVDGDPQYDARRSVFDVTWYEAMAFCAWLQEWVQRAALRSAALPEGYAFRLPTEVEWEVAAAYDRNGRRRIDPWGDAEPTPERAGYGVRELAPVGRRPASAAACDALDMAGTVWERTASRRDAYPAGSA